MLLDLKNISDVWDIKKVACLGIPMDYVVIRLDLATITFRRNGSPRIPMSTMFKMPEMSATLS